MPEGFDAGSIFVALKTQISDLEKGLSKAKLLLGQFGDKTTQTGAQVSGSGEQISSTFTKIDRDTLRITERFSRFTNRLVGAQFAMQSLQGESTKSSKAFEVASKGLGIFISTASLFPTPVGIAAGAVLGLGVAFQAATAAGKEATEVLKNAKTAVEAFKSGQRERDFQGQVAVRLRALFPDQEDVQLMTKVADKIATVQRLTSEQVAIERQINALHKQREETQKSLEERLQGWRFPIFSEVKDNQQAKEIAALEKQILQLQRNLPRVAKELGDATNALSAQRLRDSFTEAEKLTNEFAEQTKQLQLQNRFGADFVGLQKQLAQVSKLMNEAPQFVDADQLAERRRKLAADQATLLERAQQLLTTADAKAFADLDRLHTSLERQIHPLTAIEEVEQSREEVVKRIVKLKETEAFLFGQTFNSETAKKQAEERVKAQIEAMKLLVNQGEFQQMFSEPFAVGIFRGLADGILEARKPFEILAGIGENLFSNMVNSFAKQMQEQLTSTLTGLFGAGGSVLGNLFTGLAGVIGLVLSRGKSKSSQSFDQTIGRIESSQAVRGIVAGPQSVSIAAVGEDLQRALVPTNGILMDILSEIRGQRRGGSGPKAAGGFQFVAAPTT